MRRPTLPCFLLLSLLAAPTAHAAKPATATITAPAVTQLDLDITEVGKDGTRRITTLTLTLPDRRERGDHRSAELKTRVGQPIERGEVSYYRAKLELEDTPAGTRYTIDLRRAGDSQFNHLDLQLEVGRVLRAGAAQQIGRVARPDGSALIVTATLK